MHPLPLFSGVDEVIFPQNTKMVRDKILREIQVGEDRANTLFASGEEAKDIQPHRISEGLQQRQNGFDWAIGHK